MKEKYFNAQDRQKICLEDVLFTNEELLWRGKPKKSAYVFRAVWHMLGIAIIWLVADTAALVMTFKGAPPIAKIIVPIFIAIHLFPFYIWLYNVIRAVLEVRNVEYAVTDRRIVVRSGVIGIDFESILFKDIQGVSAIIDWKQRLFRAGDIYVNATEQAVVLRSVTAPYGLMKKIQRVIVDISSDMEFPNAYREEENAGFTTRYKKKGGRRKNLEGRALSTREQKEIEQRRRSKITRILRDGASRESVGRTEEERRACDADLSAKVRAIFAREPLETEDKEGSE